MSHTVHTVGLVKRATPARVALAWSERRSSCSSAFCGARWVFELSRPGVRRSGAAEESKQSLLPVSSSAAVWLPLEILVVA